MMKENTMFLLSLSVSEINHYIRDLIESNDFLSDIWIQGEISNLSKPASGHIYFTLKDSSASLRCVIWRSNAHRINLSLRNGMAVEAHGDIVVYEAGGQYQLSSDIIRHKGEGTLFQEFLRLKDKFEKEGLFNPERKKPIPQVIKKIGIVTSTTGAALKDITNTLERRNPMVEVFVSGASVQGQFAPQEISRAIKKFEELNFVDLILIARGGGALEDLWAFNDESVVRAISNCPIPIITGIGHETDFTLSDFVADLRAPTPTAAAELATVVTKAHLIEQLEDNGKLLKGIVFNYLKDIRTERTGIYNRLSIQSPKRKIRNFWQDLDGISSHLVNYRLNRFKMEYSKLKSTRERLAALNPVEVMKRGYSIITNQKNQTIISSIKQVNFGEELLVQVQDGKFGVAVNLLEN